MNDYYKILEISREADIATIKKAYRQLALRYHPDKNKSPEASEQFIKITEAYEVLCNEVSRVEYNFFYDKFVKSIQLTIYESPVYTEKQSNWSNYGKQKAAEYSSLDITQFLSKVFDEATFHGGYFLRIGCLTYFLILSGTSLIVMIPWYSSQGNFDQENGGFGILVMLAIGIGLIYYGVNSVKSEISAYKTQIKQRKNEKL